MSANMDALRLAPEAVRALGLYAPGKPLSELEREYGISNSIKLASNENPLGIGPQARDAITKEIANVGLYPDGNGFELRRALANRHGCAMEQVTLGNGSNDLLVMLAEAFLTPQVEAVYSQYCFAIYPLVVQATGAKGCVASAYPAAHPMALGHDLDAMRALVTDRTRLVFIANPNNPTGTWVEAAPLKAFIASLPQTTLVLVDEAYIEYARHQHAGFPNASTWLNEFPNLVVTRTFSKAFGLAGVRVGYALCSESIAGVLNRVRQPFNVNSLGLVGAQAALDDIEHLRRSVELNSAGLQQMTTALQALGVHVYPSVGNFVLVDCHRAGAPVYEALLRQGVIVRPLGGYGLNTHLRITIGTADENARMIAALAHALK